MSETANHNRTVGVLTIVILMAFWGLALMIGLTERNILAAIKQPCTEQTK